MWGHIRGGGGGKSTKSKPILSIDKRLRGTRQGKKLAATRFKDRRKRPALKKPRTGTARNGCATRANRRGAECAVLDILSLVGVF